MLPLGPNSVVHASNAQHDANHGCVYVCTIQAIYENGVFVYV